jgi:ribosome maturation factor RimP
VPFLWFLRQNGPKEKGKMEQEVVKQKIAEWLAPLLEEKNLFLVDVRISMGRKIEVFADSDTGITIEECAVISRFLEKHLDGSGIVPDNYILESSSPGMSNALRVPRQYKKRIGRIFEIDKNDGAHIEATLLKADDEQITLQEILPELKKKDKKKGAKEEEPKEFVVKYTDIKKAVLQFKF